MDIKDILGIEGAADGRQNCRQRECIHLVFLNVDSEAPGAVGVVLDGAEVISQPAFLHTVRDGKGKEEHGEDDVVIWELRRMKFEVLEGLFQNGEIDPHSRPRIVPIREHYYHDLTYGNRGDGKIMSLQSKTWIADDDGQKDRESAPRQHSEPGRYPIVCQENCCGISPHAEEGRIAERNLSRIAADDIPAYPHGGIEENHDCKMSREGVLEKEGKGNEAA